MRYLFGFSGLCWCLGSFLLLFFFLLFLLLFLFRGSGLRFVHDGRAVFVQVLQKAKDSKQQKLCKDKGIRNTYLLPLVDIGSKNDWVMCLGESIVLSHLGEHKISGLLALLSNLVSVLLTNVFILGILEGKKLSEMGVSIKGICKIE